MIASTPFGITAATNLVELDAKNQGRGAFTVSNRTGKPLRGRAQAVPSRAEEAAWLKVEGPAERDFAGDFTHQFTVRIDVKPGTPPGRHSFRLDMTAVTPALGETQGPAVIYEVTRLVPVPRPARAGYVATFVGAAVGAVVGAILGAVPGALFALVRASSTTVESVLAVVAIGALVVAIAAAGGGAWLNLRSQGFEGARPTGLLLAGLYAATAVVLGIVYALVWRATSGRVGAGVGVVLGLVIVLSVPVPARFVYLRLKAAGRLP